MPTLPTPETKRAHGSRPRRRRRVRYVVLGMLVVIGLLLVTARLMLPGYIKDYVNGVLDQSPEYDGRIDRVEVHLWRGAYSVEGVRIIRTTNAVPVPFFESRRVDFAVDWRALTKGQVRGRIRMEEPRLNFVQGQTEEESQAGVGGPWLGMLDELFPFRIDRAEVVKGEVHFHAFHKDPPVNVYLSDLNAMMENLTNVENKLEPLMATVSGRGHAMHSGFFEFDMTFDPQSHLPSFALAARLLKLDVNELNSLTRAYGDFDFEDGTFDLVVEAAARNGYIEGYAKPLFRNIQIVSLRDLEGGDPLQFLWESLVGIVGAVFQNQAREQFGTRITIEGDIDNPQTSILEIIGNVLRNAFVRAYLPRIEGRVAPEVAPADREELDEEPSGQGARE